MSIKFCDDTIGYVARGKTICGKKWHKNPLQTSIAVYKCNPILRKNLYKSFTY